MTDVGSVSVGVDVNGTGLGEKLAAQLRAAIQPAIEELNAELNKTDRQLDELGVGGFLRIIGSARKATEEVSKLNREIDKLDRNNSDKPATGLDRVTAAAERAAHAVDKIGSSSIEAAIATEASAKAMEDAYDRVARAAERSADRQVAAAAKVAAANEAASRAGRRGSNNNPENPPPRNPGFGVATPGRGGGLLSRFTGPIPLNLAALSTTAVAPALLGITNLLGAVQQLGQAGALLPGIFAGGLASLGTAKIATLGFGDAVSKLYAALGSGDPKALTKANAEIALLPTNVKETVTAFGDLYKPLKDVQETVANTAFEGIGQKLRDTATKDIPIFKTGLTQVSTALNGTFKGVLDALGSDSSGGFIAKIFGNTAQAQSLANAAIAPLTHALGTLTSESSDFLPRLATGFTALSNRADAFITKIAGDGTLDRWINEGIEATKSLGTSFLNIGKILGDLTKAAGGDGGFLKSLENGTTALHNFLSSADGQQKLTTFFNDAREEFHQLAPVLLDLAKAAVQVFNGFHDVGQVTLPIFGAITSFLTSTPGLVEGLVASFVGFKTIGGILSKFGQDAGAASSALGGGGASGAGGLLGNLSALKKVSILGGGALVLQGLQGLDDPDQTKSGGSQLLSAGETIAGGALTGGAIGGPFGAFIGGLVGAGAALGTFLNSVGDVSTQLKREFDKNHEGLTDPTKPSFLNAAPDNFDPTAPAGNTRPATRLPDQLRAFINSGQAPPGFAVNPDGTITGPNGSVLPGLNVAPFVPPPPLPPPPIVRNPPVAVPQLPPKDAITPTDLPSLLRDTTTPPPPTNLPPAKVPPPANAPASVPVQTPGLPEALQNVDKLKSDVSSIPPAKVQISDNAAEIAQNIENLKRAIQNIPPGHAEIAVTYNVSGAPIGLDQLVTPSRGAGQPSFGGGRAGGGIFPGYAPGIDSLWARVSPGEGVLIPEAVRGLGGGAGVYAINSMFRSGLSRTGYRSGGVVPGDPASGQGLGPLPGPDLGSVGDNSVTGLLTQIRDLLAGRGSPEAPLQKLSSSGKGIPGAAAGTAAGAAGGTQLGPFGTPLKKRGTPAYEAAAAAIQALGGDPERFLGTDPAFTSPALGGTAAAGGANPDSIAALTAFAQTGTVTPGVDPTSPVARAILAARNKKKGGLGDDAIAGLVNSTLTTGTFNGTLDANNTSLVQALLKGSGGAGLTAAANAAVPQGAGVPAAPGAVSAAPPAAGTIGAVGSVQAVYVVNFPGQPLTNVPGLPPGANAAQGVTGGGAAGPGGATNYLGKSVVDAATGAIGQTASSVAGSGLDAILSATDFKIGTPTSANAGLSQLLKEGNPNAIASAFGANVPDYSRAGGQGTVAPTGPQFDSKGQMYSDAGALIDRTFTSLQTQTQAFHDQEMSVLNQIKDNLGEKALKPVLTAGVTSGIDGISDATATQIGADLGTAAGPPIAQVVAQALQSIASSVSAQAASSGNTAEGVPATPTSGISGLAGTIGNLLFTSPADSVGYGDSIAASHGLFPTGSIHGSLFDEGGLWTPGTAGTNLSGAVERVLDPVQTRLFDAGLLGGWNAHPLQQHMAASENVDATSTLGGDFFGVSQLPIIGAIVNILVSVLLKLIGVNITERDTLSDMSSDVRQFRGDFQKFDASGRLFNDNSGLLDRSSTSEQEAADERIRILKLVIEGLIKFIIEKIVIPIASAVANAAISAGGAAAGAAVNSQAPGAGGIVSALIDSGGQAGVGIVADLATSLTDAATPVLVDSIGGAIQNLFPGLTTNIFGGGLMSLIANPLQGILGGLTGGLAGVFATLLGGLSFDEGGVASGVGLMPKATIRPERVLSPSQTQSFDRLVTALERSGGSGAQTVVHAPFTVVGGTQAGEQAHAKLLSLLGGA